MNFKAFKYVLKSFKLSFGGYKRRVFFLTSLGFLSGFLDVVGIGAFIPIISLALKQDDLGADFITEFLIKIFGYIHLDLRISWLLIFVSTLFVIKAIVLFIFGYVTSKINNDYERDRRDYLYAKTLQSNWSFLLGQKIGHLENLLMLQVKFASRFLTFASGFILNVSSFVVYLITAFKLLPLITFISIFVGLVFFLLSKFLVKRTKKYASRQYDLWHEAAHEINENIVGLKTIKVMRVEKYLIEFARNIFDQLKFFQIRSHLVKTLNSAPIQPMSIIFASVIFAISYKQPNFSLGIFAVALYLINRIFSYIEKIQDSFHSLASLSESVIKLSDFENQVMRHQEQIGERFGFKFSDSLVFQNTCFSYNADVQALHNVNFTVKKGEIVGVVGPSGSGKTTVVDLLLRLFEPTEGKILIDGIDISRVDLDDWRKNVGYVSQDIFLKNFSIADNIRFFDSRIAKEDIIKSAKMANIHDFVMSLQNGYDTIVGERGIMLSGGQRQRVVLARVLAKNPKVLVLDEATSALDSESEAAIKEMIDNIKGKITIIVIAHRISTIYDADKIVVLKSGRVHEVGKFADFMKNPNSYLFGIANSSNAIFT